MFINILKLNILIVWYLILRILILNLHHLAIGYFLANSLTLFLSSTNSLMFFHFEFTKSLNSFSVLNLFSLAIFAANLMP